MPTIFSHAVFATVAGKAFLKTKVSGWFWFLAAVCAIIPDADVFGRSFGVERGSMFAHRGFTHSITFAVLFGAFAAFIARRFLKTKLSFARSTLFFSLATLSHPLLDMLTDGGSGAALFSPFSNERFFFPWRPIEVSPIGLRFFSSRGVTVMLSELLWVWLPAIVIFFISLFIRRKGKNVIHEKEVKGVRVDRQTRCAHYHTPVDIIAIKFKCCNEWFPCFECHREITDHLPEVWTLAEFDEKAILCGNCGHQLSVSEYMSCNSICPECSASFNPGCANHYQLYFETSREK